MNPDPLLLLAATPAVAFAGVAKGGFGGAAAFAAAPMLAFAMPVTDAVGLMLPLLILMDVAALRAYWGRWARPARPALGVRLAPGAGFGCARFEGLSPAAIQLALGAISLAFVGFRFAQRVGWRPAGASGWRPGRMAFWGSVAGLTSFVAHAGGPPVAMALIPRALDKTAYQATVVIGFAVVNALKVPPYVALGLIGPDTLVLAALLAPAAFLGVRLGVRMHRRVRQETFEAAVLVGLALAGAKLARDGALDLL